MNDEWIDDRAALRETAGMLAAADYLTTAQDVVDFLDKPWKWETERTLWLEAGSPQPDTPSWDLFDKRLQRQEEQD